MDSPASDVAVLENASDTVVDFSGAFADVDIATNADTLTLTVVGNTAPGLVLASFDGTDLTLDYLVDSALDNDAMRSVAHS